MKPHPRIRKTVKWGGAVVCVVLLAVWAESNWRGAVRMSPSVCLEVGGGGVWVTRPQQMSGYFDAPGWYFDRTVFHFHWWFKKRTGSPLWWLEKNPGSPLWWFMVPIWVFVVFALVPTFAAWRLDALARRRARVSLCPACNYNRRGIPAASVCPECGAVPAGPPQAST